jgi:hypothetical protein
MLLGRVAQIESAPPSPKNVSGNFFLSSAAVCRRKLETKLFFAEFFSSLVFVAADE